MFVTNDEIELYLTKNKTELGSDSARLEEEYKQLFMGTIRHELNVVSRNDFNPRAGPMISTPSMGVEGSKKEISLDPQNPNYGDGKIIEFLNELYIFAYFHTPSSLLGRR